MLGTFDSIKNHKEVNSKMRRQRITKTLVIMLSIILIVTFLFSGCGEKETDGLEDTEKSQKEVNTDEEEKDHDDAEDKDGVEDISFEFWAAPNPTQSAFWKQMAEKYQDENPNIDISVTAIPEKPSSEASIQAAIAAKKAPAASENIMRSFGAELAKNEAIVALNDLPGWDEIIEERNMSKTIESWQLEDGKQYVFPIYSNAMLFGWRLDILKELGYDEPPKTYSEIIEVGKKLKEQDAEKFIWARDSLAKNDWWERWFDFFMLYNAASDGDTFIDGSEFVADEEAGIKVLEFMKDLEENDLLLTDEATDPFETGVGIFSTVGPWDFPGWEEKYPELKFGENLVLAAPPVPDGVDPSESKTFADAKGVVIYSQATPEQQEAVWDFVKYVFADAENELKWLEATNLPPARDDLAENEVFAQYLSENPELGEYAKMIPNAVPPISNPNVIEIQTIIGEQAVNPIISGQKDTEQAWEDMKQEIEEVLSQ